MLILRLLLILAALFIVFSGGAYMLTRNRRYLSLAWLIVRFVIFMLLIFVVLFLLERYVLVGWRIFV
ncbi:MAG: hypothetical protein K8R50_05575 [Betaproteobacteria bacterium]|nr:hypothetical protein [Betaproteobacteria bacterium]